jgi:hypothetical protein
VPEFAQALPLAAYLLIFPCGSTWNLLISIYAPLGANKRKDFKMTQEGRSRINVTLSPKVLKKLGSVSRKSDESKSEIIEAALIQFFASPRVFENLFTADKSFRDLLPITIYKLAKAMGLQDGLAARVAIEQKEANENEEIEEHLEERDSTGVPIEEYLAPPSESGDTKE